MTMCVEETGQNKHSAAIDEQTMSLYYTHLLIPEGANFVPQSKQVVALLDGLTQLGSTPHEPTFKLGKPGHRATAPDPSDRYYEPS
jgi:hypothetical protein